MVLGSQGGWGPAHLDDLCFDQSRTPFTAFDRCSTSPSSTGICGAALASVDMTLHREGG